MSADFWPVARRGAPCWGGKRHRPPPRSSSASPPVPMAGSVQLPAPSNSSGARWHRQPGHGFLSSSWGQQLLLSCGTRGTLFPGKSSPGETREQVVQIRNTSVGDCFKTRLFQASRRTKDVKRSAQHHSVDGLPAGALPSCFPDWWQPEHPLHPSCSLLLMGTAGGGTQREEGGLRGKRW